MIKINWLWDSRLSEKEAMKILKDENHPKFDLYAERLLSRVSNPIIVLDLIDEVTFCKKWPLIKKRMRKNAWLKDRIIFWETIYGRIHDGLKDRGVKVRHPRKEEIPLERMKLASQIRDIRIKLGHTQKDIAGKLEVRQQYISRIESGHENVSIDTLKRIADVFGKRLVIKLR